MYVTFHLSELEERLLNRLGSNIGDCFGDVHCLCTVACL